MDGDLRKRWVEALRSGKYEQGQKHLRCNGRYCCLGVLLDVYEPDGWKDRNVHEPHDLASDEELSAAALEELRLPSRHHHDLISMNDDAGATFAEIADWIEANIAGQPPQPEASRQGAADPAPSNSNTESRG